MICSCRDVTRTSCEYHGFEKLPFSAFVIHFRRKSDSTMPVYLSRKKKTLRPGQHRSQRLQSFVFRKLGLQLLPVLSRISARVPLHNRPISYRSKSIWFPFKYHAYVILGVAYIDLHQDESERHIRITYTFGGGRGTRNVRY